MKTKLMILITALVMIAPAAHAQIETSSEFNTQYYSMLRDTCQKNNVERLWNRWFGDKQKHLSEDTCCIDSIAAMEKTQSLETEADGSCPAGTEKKSLQCPTSKTWCEKI